MKVSRMHAVRSKEQGKAEKLAKESNSLCGGSTSTSLTSNQAKKMLYISCSLCLLKIRDLSLG